MNTECRYRQRRIRFVLVWILAGIVFFGVWDRLFWTAWRGLKFKRTAARRELEQKRRILAQYAVADPDRETRLLRYRQRDPDEQVRNRMLVCLRAAAEQNRIRIVSMKPLPVRQEGPLKEFSISMNVEGSIADVVRFFDDVESGDNHLKIQEFRAARVHVLKDVLGCQMTAAWIFMDK